jgi:hypothetical protein
LHKAGQLIQANRPDKRKTSQALRNFKSSAKRSHLAGVIVKLIVNFRNIGDLIDDEEKAVSVLA